MVASTFSTPNYVSLFLPQKCCEFYKENRKKHAAATAAAK